MRRLSHEITNDVNIIDGEKFEFFRLKIISQLTEEEYPQLVERKIFRSESEVREYLQKNCSHEAITDTGENLLFCQMCDKSWTEAEWKKEGKTTDSFGDCFSDSFEKFGKTFKIGDRVAGKWKSPHGPIYQADGIITYNPASGFWVEAHDDSGITNVDLFIELQKVESKIPELCYKTDVPCKFGCTGLCKESC